MVFLFTLCVGSVFAASATEPYRPYLFHDQTLYQRSDIKRELERQVYKVPTQTLDTFESVRSEDADLFFFSELGKLLRKAHLANTVSSAALESKISCEQHEQLTEADLHALKTSASCGETRALLQEAVYNKVHGCLDMQQPEAYLRRLPAYLSWDKSRFRGLQNLIATAGQQLLGYQWPANFIDPNFIDRARTVLLRLRYTVVKENLQRQLRRYEALTNSCVTQENAANFNDKIQKLKAESDQALLALETVYATGVAQAEQDALAVHAKGKIRAQLPYPALTDADREWLSLHLLAVYWRMRGGGVIRAPGTQMARKMFAEEPINALVELNCGKHCPGRVSEIGYKMREKLILKGWHDWFDMGRRPGEPDRYFDLTYLTVRGEFQVKDSVWALQNAGFEASPFLLGGLQFGSCYWYTWNHLDRGANIGDDLNPEFPALTHNATSWGELCYGGALGLGLSRSLLAGHSSAIAP